MRPCLHFWNRCMGLLSKIDCISKGYSDRPIQSLQGHLKLFQMNNSRCLLKRAWNQCTNRQSIPLITKQVRHCNHQSQDWLKGRTDIFCWCIYTDTLLQNNFRLHHNFWSCSHLLFLLALLQSRTPCTGGDFGPTRSQSLSRCKYRTLRDRSSQNPTQILYCSSARLNRLILQYCQSSQTSLLRHRSWYCSLWGAFRAHPWRPWGHLFYSKRRQPPVHFCRGFLNLRYDYCSSYYSEPFQSDH